MAAELRCREYEGGPMKRSVVALMLVGVVCACTAGPQPSAAQSTTTSPSNAPSGTPAPTPPDYSTRAGWLLLDHFGANGLDGLPEVGPDGRSLWLVKADGTQLHELARGNPLDGKTNPDWSRDGKHIAFQTIDPRTLIFETDPAGSPPLLVSVGCSGDAQPCLENYPAYSPDGNRIAFVTTTDGFATAVIGIRDRCTPATKCAAGTAFQPTVTTIESTRIPIAGLDTPGVTWSPDGKTLAYYRIAVTDDSKPTGPSDLWVVGVDGTNLHKVPLPAGMVAGDPDWSPDSSLLVFGTQPIHNFNDEGLPDVPDVYTVRPDGTDLHKLTNGGQGGAPIWTSDGLILFYADRTRWPMNADGTNKAKVFKNGPVIWGEATGWSYYGYWQPSS